MMSFPYTEDRSEAIRFHTDGNEAPNVLIGPNGSGKTNFLKILKQMITYGIVEDMVYIDTPTMLNQTIYWNQNIPVSINPHFLSPEKPSFSRIEIKITGTDRDNLLFVQKQRDQLNQIINTYSTI